MSKLDYLSIVSYLDHIIEQLDPRNRNLCLILSKYIKEKKIKTYNLQEFYDVLFPNSQPESQRVGSSIFLKAINDTSKNNNLDFKIRRDASKKKPFLRDLWFEGNSLTNHQISKSNLQELSVFDRDYVNQTAVIGDDETGNKIIYILFAQKDNIDKSVDEFVNSLKEMLHTKSTVGNQYQINISTSTNTKEQELELISNSDLVLILYSANFLSDKQLEANLLHSIKKPCFSINYNSIDAGTIKQYQDKISNIIGFKKIFEQDKNLNGQVYKKSNKKFFVSLLADRLVHLLESKNIDISNILDSKLEKATYMTAFITEGLSDNSTSFENEVDVQDILYNWSIDNNSSKYLDTISSQNTNEKSRAKPLSLYSWPTFIALLGDYGAGKTWTCMQFVKQLETKIKNGENIKKPLLLNLQLINAQKNIQEFYTLEEIIQVCLQKDSSDNFDVPYIVDNIKSNEYILIIDGIDEILVHLDSRKSFALIKIFVDIAKNNNCKTLITCRTHYFKDLSEQKSFLTCGSRTNIQANDFISLKLRNFSFNQIQQYLDKNLDNQELYNAKKAFDTINNLKDLAQKPYHLKLIIENMGDIISKVNGNQRFNLAYLYNQIIQESFQRDIGKHTLKTEHKLVLLEDLAAFLWLKKTPYISFERLSSWLNKWLAQNPHITQFYDLTLMSDKIYQDVRTSSLLVRKDSKLFAFAHNSLLNYFLAKYLISSLETQNPQNWDAIEPSHDTIEFIIDSINESLSIEYEFQESFLKLFELNLISRKNAFLVWVGLGDKIKKPTNINLQCTNLSHIQLIGSKIDYKIISDVDFANVNMSDSYFKYVYFIDCNFDGVIAHNSIWEFVRFENCNLNLNSEGLLLRRCEGHDIATNKFTNIINYESNNKSLDHKTPTTSVGFSSFVTCFDIAKDESYIACGSYYGDIKLANTKGEFIKSFKAHNGQINACNISHDNKYIVTSSDDKSVKIFDLDGNIITTIKESSHIHSCEFSKDDKHIIYGVSNQITIASLKGKKINEFKVHTGSVLKCIFSNDDSCIVSASNDNTIKIIDTNKNILLNFKEEKSFIKIFATSNDNKYIAVGLFDGTLRIIDFNGNPIINIKAHNTTIVSCVFSNDSKYITTSSRDNTLKVWDIQGKLIKELIGHTSWVSQCKFTSDNKHIISSSYDNSIKFWNLDGQNINTLKHHDDSALSCSFSPDGKQMISTCNDSSLKLWDLQTSKAKILRSHKGIVLSCSFSPDGKYIISSSYYGNLRLWDGVTGQFIKSFKAHYSVATCCGFSPDSKTIISGSNDHTIKLFSLDGECLKVFEGHYGGINACTFSPNGKNIISCSSDNTLKLWNLDGECIQDFEGHTKSVSDCTFSPNGKNILSSSHDGVIKLWDINGTHLMDLDNINTQINCCCFSSDGRHIVYGDNNHSLSLIDIQTLQKTLFIGHQSIIRCCTFSPDGKYIISGSYDGTIKLWDMSGKCIKTFFANTKSMVVYDDKDFLYYTGDAWRFMFYKTQEALVNFDSLSDYKNYEMSK